MGRSPFLFYLLPILMKKVSLAAILLSIVISSISSKEIVITPKPGDDAFMIQNTLDTLQPGDTLILQGAFVIARTLYLPSEFTWILNGSLSLSEIVNLDRIGFVGPGVDARRPTGITEKPGGAKNIEMSGGSYYGFDVRSASKTIRLLNFVAVTDSYFHDFSVIEGSDDGFTLGPECRYNECRRIVGSGAQGNALTDKGEFNKWYDCIAEDCGSDGWTPKCRYSEFHRCIGRRNAGPGFGCFARLDGSGDPVDLGEIIVGNKFFDCEAYDNERGGFSFNIASTSGEGSVIRDNYIQALCYNNRMQGVGFRNKQISGIIEDNEVDLLVFGNQGLKEDGTLSSYAGGLGVEGEVSTLSGSIVGYHNGGYDVNVKSAADCSILVYQPDSQDEAVINSGPNTIHVNGFNCSDPLDTWCQTKYCEFIVPMLPLPPGDLLAIAISSSQVNLSWSYMSGNEDGLMLEQKINEGFKLLDTLEANIASYSDTGLLAETSYSYRLRAFNFAGFSEYTPEVSVKTEPEEPTWIYPGQDVVPGIIIYPNPFKGSARLTYTLPGSCFVSLKVFDHSGRELRTLVHKHMPAGTHTLDLDGTNLPLGACYCRLISGSRLETRKFILF